MWWELHERKFKKKKKKSFRKKKVPQKFKTCNCLSVKKTIFFFFFEYFIIIILIKDESLTFQLN